MLQQTRAETVIPYYQRFLERFPDVESLADADQEEVYGLWAGLGYYSRARNLHAAARIVAEDRKGCFPDQVEELRSLPGIGAYTAGAVASMAFDRPEPVVDGNVSRVLARLLGIRQLVTSGPVVKRLWKEARSLVRGPRPGDLNQAVMELGATLCTPRNPRCGVCPLRGRCVAHRRGETDSIPVRPRRRPVPRIQSVAAWLPRKGKILAVRRPPGGLLGGLWEFPGGALEDGEPPTSGLKRILGERLGLTVKRAQRLGEIEHQFTHRRLRLHVFRCDTPMGRVRLDGFDAHRWLPPGRLGELAQGALTRKALALVAASKTRGANASLVEPSGGR
jgi:A/G-specific adenine glycosylase